MLVSKRKRYLSGSDWVINTLDYMMKSATCAGNMSQVVLLLRGPVDEQDVRTRLNGFVRRFPVVQGAVARDAKLAPYWKIPAVAARDVPFSVTQVASADPGAVFPLLVQSANTRFRDDNEHLSFHLIRDGGKSVLAMAFDHRIFDARGAEMFLDLFQRSLEQHDVPGDIAFASSAALTGWRRKFLAGRNVNRRIIALSRASVPAALPIPEKKGGGYKYRLLAFGPKETDAIYERAYQEAGYLMESPYILSVIMQAVHQQLRDRFEKGASYLIPVTTDLRPGRDLLGETFFNHVTYLFYQIPAELAGDRAALIAVCKQQMYDQVKSGFPKDLEEASLLTRIAPLPLLGKLLHLPLQGKMATFAFSHLGKSSFQSSVFLNREIENLFHMPRVPVPPGLGFFSSRYNGRLNLVISCLDGLAPDREIDSLAAAIREKLGVSS